MNETTSPILAPACALALLTTLSCALLEPPSVPPTDAHTKTVTMELFQEEGHCLIEVLGIAVISEHPATPNKVTWKVVDKQAGHSWEIVPEYSKDGETSDGELSFQAGKSATACNQGDAKIKTEPAQQGDGGSWYYSIVVRGCDNGEPDPDDEICRLDPQIYIRGG